MELTASNEQQFVKRLTNVIEVNLHNEQFGVNELAHELGMSRATLHRKVKTIVKKSVTEFIRESRLKRANELLLQKVGTISEIAYLVGFGSVTYFTKCYHDYYGYPPGEAEKRDISENHTKEKHEGDIQPKWGRKKILVGGIILVALITVLAVIILAKPFQPRTLPKTIAVLPFINDSQDTSNVYFINGVMEGILDNLSKIHDLKVHSRISSEQYRNNKTKSIKQIAKELGVAYIVEGSGQKYGNQIKLSIQLIDVKSDSHLWSQQYDRKWEDIFAIQSEIAKLVANKIEAVITPEEKELINKKPTKSISAYNRLLHAEQLISIGQDESDQVLFQRAEQYIRDAIRIDSTYSEAYVKLGWALAGRGLSSDTLLYLANHALHFDNQNADAYYLKGWFLLSFLWKIDEAEDAFKFAIKYNPSHSSGYAGMGDAMFYKGNYIQLVENKLKAINLVKGPTRTVLMYYFSFQLYSLGVFKEGLKFSEEIIENYGDSSSYYLGLEAENMNSGNYAAAYQNVFKTGRNYNLDWWCKGNICLRLRDFKGALKFVEGYYANGGQNIPSYYFGYTYLKNGLIEKADFHFKGVIKAQKEIIKQNVGRARGYAYYTLVITYSAMGDKVKAVENMKKMLEHKDEIPISPVVMLEFKNHPMCDIIRETHEQKEILRIAEERFQPVKKDIESQLEEFFN